MNWEIQSGTERAEPPDVRVKVKVIGCGNLSCKTVHFPHLLDLLHVSMWQRAQRKCLERGGSSRKGDWMNRTVRGDSRRAPLHFSTMKRLSLFFRYSKNAVEYIATGEFPLMFRS